MKLFNSLAIAAIIVGTASATPIATIDTGTSVFTIISDSTGEGTNVNLVTSMPAGWGTIPNASWIAPQADQDQSVCVGTCIGDIDYETTFSLLANQSPYVQLTLTMLADDYVNVELNGNTVFTTSNFGMYGNPATVTTIISGFQTGTNTLDFIAHNAGGPTGLDVDGAVNIVTPEPATFGLIGATLLLGGAFRIRRSKA